MPLHKTNSLLKYGIGAIIILLLIAVIKGLLSSNASTPAKSVTHNAGNLAAASSDSEAESLNTLTAELAATKQQMQQITTANAQIRQQNAELLTQLKNSSTNTPNTVASEVSSNPPTASKQSSLPPATASTADSSPQPLGVVTDISQPSTLKNFSNPLNLFDNNAGNQKTGTNNTATANKISGMGAPWANINNLKPKPIPYYTIPANATAVDDKLMSALVGRIPVKGVVTDPYPFKIVFSNDTLAANGLRVPHLQQMIVTGYTEGDLNLLSVRGWITSLTFVFDDGTINTTTSNDNNIGHFTKDNALGYLSDSWGNPFIRGKLITNAPSYLTGNVALGAAAGAASAFAQSQTTNQTSLLGTSSSTVTGSANKYVAGMAAVNAANQVQEWWHDREEQSFDAIYVAAGETVVVNFAKQIPIDYNPQGRKVSYAHAIVPHPVTGLD